MRVYIATRMVGLVISQTPCSRIVDVRVQHRRDRMMYVCARMIALENGVDLSMCFASQFNN